jgi:hypothetical protein
MPVFRKKSEYLNQNQDVNVEPPEQSASTPSTTPSPAAEPQTRSEWIAFSERLLQKKRDAEARQVEVANEIQSLALRSYAGDAGAVARLAELKGKARELQDETRLLADAQLEVARRIVQSEAYEATAVVMHKRERFESLLNESLTLAEQADMHLSNFAIVMNQRAALLAEAQGMCASSEERSRVTQLLSKQASSWQMGHLGLQKYFEQSDLMFPNSFDTLAAFTRLRLQNWGLVQPAPEPAPTAEQPKKELVN